VKCYNNIDKREFIIHFIYSSVTCFLLSWVWLVADHSQWTGW